MPGGPSPELGREDVALLIRRLTGAEAPYDVVVAAHARLAAEPGRLAELIRCLLGDTDTAQALSGFANGRQATSPAFRRDGDIWALEYGGIVLRLRDARGLWYLAQLLARPGEAVPVEELVAAAPGRRIRPIRAARARVSVTKAIGSALVRIEALHPALGAHLAATVRRGRRCAYLPDEQRPLG